MVPAEAAPPWRVSTGSAAVLGLRPAPLAAPPATAYLMLGERCAADCAFCAQARTSDARADQLSRVNWPLFDPDVTAEAIAQAAKRGDIRRACFQVTQSPGAHAAAQQAIATLAQASRVPICVSIGARGLDEIEALLTAGAQRVTLALDAATPALYAQAKGGSWERIWALLRLAAGRFPGQIGTHLIAGLGETEEEILNLAQTLLRMGIHIGLFAFTPIPGTRLAQAQAPSLESYRRVQAGLWLLKEGLSAVEAWLFERGRLVDYGATGAALAVWLAGGEAFCTAGCPDCNRPYYNERPSGPLYNYPRPLTDAEADEEIARLLHSLEV
jgi:lipoyl synthase